VSERVSVAVVEFQPAFSPESAERSRFTRLLVYARPPPPTRTEISYAVRWTAVDRHFCGRAGALVTAVNWKRLRRCKCTEDDIQ